MQSLKPSDNLTLTAMAATTNTQTAKIFANSSLRIQANYNSDTWGLFGRFQKKTENFEQALVGFPEVNNSTEANTWVGYKFRFENQDLRTIRLNFNANHNGSFDNSMSRLNININTNFNFQFKEIGFVGFGGGTYQSRGYFRNYDFDSTNVSNVLSDNYGSFVPTPSNGDGYFMWAESDYSNTFAGGFNYSKDLEKNSPIHSYGFNVQIKPSESFKVQLGYDIYDIVGSEELEKEYLTTKSLRLEYALLNNLFLKSYTQFNSQSDRLSNNILATFEYDRGSFIYFAYNETGNLDNNYKNGSILENFKLDRRVISIKWSSPFYF